MASRLGHRAVELLSEGKGNRVVGISKSSIIDCEINEALAMKNVFKMELFKIAEEISF
jgi:6-phosphofructokinase 1